VFLAVCILPHIPLFYQKKRKKISIVIIFIKYSNPGPIVANQIEIFLSKKKKKKIFKNVSKFSNIII
jgi:uncharacterized membrane protein